MEMKSFAATLGLGIVAGAAAAFLIPKQSKVYKTASDAAERLKDEVAQTMNSWADR